MYSLCLDVIIHGINRNHGNRPSSQVFFGLFQGFFGVSSLFRSFSRYGHTLPRPYMVMKIYLLHIRQKHRLKRFYGCRWPLLLCQAVGRKIIRR